MVIRFFGAIVLLAALLVSAAGIGEEPAPVTQQNKYEVLRKGKKIGSHTITFERKNGQLVVLAETTMKVKFLFLTAYRYHYRSEEIWENGVLLSVRTQVNDNGKKRGAYAVLGEEDYEIGRPGGLDHFAGDFITSNHWNTHAPKHQRIFNTITGKMNEVEFSVVEETASTLEYAVRGDLDINTRYHREGYWMGMYFNHKDGSLIEFRCIDCMNGPVTPS